MENHLTNFAGHDRLAPTLIINKMKELEYKHFRNKEEFRDWLQKYHDASPGIWMVFYKKHLSIDCIQYSEALEEALCFGWIDSLIKKLDDAISTSISSNNL